MYDLTLLYSNGFLCKPDDSLSTLSTQIVEFTEAFREYFPTVVDLINSLIHSPNPSVLEIPEYNDSEYLLVLISCESYYRILCFYDVVVALWDAGQTTKITHRSGDVLSTLLLLHEKRNLVPHFLILAGSLISSEFYERNYPCFMLLNLEYPQIKKTCSDMLSAKQHRPSLYCETLLSDALLNKIQACSYMTGREAVIGRAAVSVVIPGRPPGLSLWECAMVLICLFVWI
jgi:hypothetical protein